MEVYQAGAEFIFAPNVNERVIRLTKQLGMLSIPEAYTPTECQNAYDAGADVVKLFPITEREVGYVKNIARPLSHIPFLCVGGVNPDTIPLYLEAGAVGVGTGISILKPELLAKDDYAAIGKLAAEHVRACFAGKVENVGEMWKIFWKNFKIPFDIRELLPYNIQARLCEVSYAA